MRQNSFSKFKALQLPFLLPWHVQKYSFIFLTLLCSPPGLSSGLLFPLPQISLACSVCVLLSGAWLLQLLQTLLRIPCMHVLHTGYYETPVPAAVLLLAHYAFQGVPIGCFGVLLFSNFADTLLLPVLLSIKMLIPCKSWRCQKILSAWIFVFVGYLFTFCCRCRFVFDFAIPDAFPH